jgi:N-acetylated-alpha-linked acidic dipeptidase
MLFVALAVAAAPDLAKISGFSPRAAAQEIITENSFRAAISTPEIIKFHRYLTAEPHPAGSARNNELAQWVAEQWRQQGLEDVTVHQYDVLHSSPREVSLEMVKPSFYRAGLREAAYDVDPDTKNPKVDGAYLG